MKTDLKQLTTDLHGKTPSFFLGEQHPRPQLRRDSFLNLNGIWNFETGQIGSDVCPENFIHTIRVPYPTESTISGIGTHYPEGAPLWYSRILPDISRKKHDRVLLHIDAVDQEADVYINGTHAAHICTFEGRDGIDITDLLKADAAGQTDRSTILSSGRGSVCNAEELSDTNGHLTRSETETVNDKEKKDSAAQGLQGAEENVLTICVTDDLRKKEFPYGKQTLKRGGMWYTPFSGIWQSVWIEVVPEMRIQALKIRTSLTEAVIEIIGPSNGTVLFEEKEIPFQNGIVTLTPEDPVCWTPDEPKLYPFMIRAGEDEVRSYFALRTLSVQKENGTARLCLNGKPFFFHGLLDQGYWPDGLCTPPGPESFEYDILSMKELGFNTLRKHIKLEPEQFYYDCDRLGMVVFQDMINNGSYSFFRDTVLPTIGIRRINDRKHGPEQKIRQMFLESMKQTAAILYNHPSVCCWTIFNEGWGQFCADDAFETLKALDDTRWVDTASGWFLPEKSDVLSLHVYFKKFRLPESEQPVLLSEFGGYSCKIEGHSFNLTKTYGYRFFKDPALYMDVLEKLYEEEILPAVQHGLSGAIYTQVSDVEDETNGLLTYDRAVCKPDKQRMLQIAKKLRRS